MRFTITNLFAPVLFLLISTPILADDRDTTRESPLKNWFLGAALNVECITEQEEDSLCANTKLGTQINAGYQFNDIFKLIVGYNRIKVDNTDNQGLIGIPGTGEIVLGVSNNKPETLLSFTLRSQWLLDSNWLYYLDATVNLHNIKREVKAVSDGRVVRSSSNTNTLISAGFGIGHVWGNHEIDIGYETIDFGSNNRGIEAEYSLQYF
ncbi:MAG: hypothetical protein L3J46_01210 [Kangiellaceae bacterium]|nr:hypothetical protein [Kangiellaceae bacterium]